MCNRCNGKMREDWSSTKWTANVQSLQLNQWPASSKVMMIVSVWCHMRRLNSQFSELSAYKPAQLRVFIPQPALAHCLRSSYPIAIAMASQHVRLLCSLESEWKWIHPDPNEFNDNELEVGHDCRSAERCTTNSSTQHKHKHKQAATTKRSKPATRCQLPATSVHTTKYML